MRILSFHAGAHDVSAAALEDYKLVAAVAEERLTRLKNFGGVLPWLAIDEVLRIADLTDATSRSLPRRAVTFRTPVIVFRFGMR
jgi:predicted NodU family carbamoyl transferase